MKRTVLIFGSIAGLIVTALMVYSTISCYRNADFEGNMLLGYASMLLAFSFVFVGIKSYRDNYNQGVITFGKAFRVGLFITLIASSMYVIIWLIDYYVFIPDFMDKYVAHVLRELKADGASPTEVAKKQAELATYADLYKSPFWVILLTYTEVLPIGLIISLISAWILRRNSTDPNVAMAN
jgi:hypothetical protein